MSYYETDDVDRAVALYHRWHERAGTDAQQPSRSDSEQFGDRIILRNVNGDLARYRVREDGRIRRTWPRRAAV